MRGNKSFASLAFLLFFALSVHGAELRPWFTDSFLLFTNQIVEVEHFSQFATPIPTESSHNTIVSYHPSWQFAVADYAAEVEARFSDTDKLVFSSEYFAQTLRYLVRNDIAGDDISLAVGITYRQVSRQHLLDSVQIHHGRNEWDFHLSIGKEYASFTDWILRSYAVAICSVGDHGSPWLTCRGGIDFRINPCQIVELDIEWKQGLGKQELDLSVFKGYGSIHHRTLDISAKYVQRVRGWDIGFWSRIRCVSRNAPKDLVALGLELTSEIPLFTAF
jgi:hypothetical protein